MRELEPRGDPHGLDAGSAADYIATLADELAQIAKRHGLESLGHILEMATLEAKQVSKGAAGTKECA
jgi:hypothetical protein